MRMGNFIWAVILSAIATAASADDWPQWMGPQRDSEWRETGIHKRFPKDGLTIRWRAPVALGYSGPAVSDGKVFVTDYAKTSGEISNNPGKRDKLEGSERIICFAADTGKELWRHEYACRYQLSYPGGPRCTPTVDAGKVYALGSEGDLVCLDANSGDVIWKKNFKSEYKVETPIWGFSAHPLVVGNRLYCVVGGKGSVAVAFDKNTGREIWRALSAPEPGYCPPTMINHGGTQQLLIWHPEAINSLNPDNGEVYWSVPLKPSYRMSINAPRKSGNVLFASGIGTVAALMKLDSQKPGAEVVWRGKTKMAVYGANSTPFIHEGVIYGCDCRSGALVAARLEDGKRLWETFEPTTGERRAAHGTAFIVKHEDRFFLFNESGDLILAQLSPEGYKELDRFHVLEPSNTAFNRPVVWSHPAFAGKCMYARNDKELVCVSLAAER